MTQFIKLTSWKCHALTPKPVTIEVLRSRGLNQLSLTGLPDAWLRDSRDKIRALVASHASWGTLERVLVHLLPADESKNGAHLELPIVLGCMIVLSDFSLPPAALEALKRYKFVGSLTLEGKLIHTELSRVLEQADPERTLGPSRFKSLSEVWSFLRTIPLCVPELRREATLLRLPGTEASDAAEPRVQVRDRHKERFWLFAAAIAQLPTLLIGPPGAGKSHLARWASRLLPVPDAETEFQIRQIWHLNGERYAGVTPTLAPHSRTHIADFLGKTRQGIPRPGIFTLAHGGTLILDEFTELNRDCREILRTLLDKKVVHKAEAQNSIDWPADFWLIATTNPCPCGYDRGETHTWCTCLKGVREMYQSRLSGPLLDRFGLKIYVDPQFERDEKARAGLERLMDLSRLDAPETELRALVAECRRRAQPGIAPAHRIVLDCVSFAHFSEREKLNKARLLATLAALSGRSVDAPELLNLIYLLVEMERSTFRSRIRTVALDPYLDTSHVETF